MAQVPVTTRFIGIADSVDLTERKSAQANTETEPYTMQDIADSISAGPVAGIYIIQQGFTSNPIIAQPALDQLGLISMTRGGAGLYTMNFPANTFDTLLPNAIINVKYTQFTATNTPTITANIASDSTISIWTVDSSGNFVDNVLDYTEINITVFN